MSTPKFSVAICRSGIAGLTAAIAISHFSSEKDIQVNIYEAAQEITEIGAGIGLYKRPRNVMNYLYFREHLERLCEVPAVEDKSYLAFRMRKSNQQKGVPFYDTFTPMGTLLLHRIDFINTLVARLDSEIITSSPTAPITLAFKDGTTSTCDVLIAADGIHSATRHTMLELAATDSEADGSEEGGGEAAKMLRGMVDPIWSGRVAYRALVPREKLEKINPNHSVIFTAQSYSGKSKHTIVFPISQGRLMNVVAFCSWPDKVGTIFEGKTVEDRSKEELLELYAGWEEEVQKLLQVCLYNFLDCGRLLTIRTPWLPTGAGQAIEDAYILGALLASPLTTLSTLPISLKVYEEVRLPHGNAVQQRSAGTGRLYEFDDPRFADLANKELGEADKVTLSEIGDAAVELWKWAWTTDIEDDRSQAMALLKERVEGRSSV
ncbi:hypothetical protein EW145_g2621 [Phellinidium pouzarii]|uniref:FAD-binding domain-containing protein n=1 Tax=Phellinidium pouzarii TaxID=167371 RepID=A0A4S4LFL8_9AGAM|nr:hypothetical protein EW145_g2621 [Phellinidium pouzarii]